MERIVLEVDEQAIKAYRSLGLIKQQQFFEAVSMLVKKAANDATASTYRKALDEFGDTGFRNGLTEDILASLLKEND